jgi:23S rRNA (uracil1939-C5)-methyltransferase
MKPVRTRTPPVTLSLRIDDVAPGGQGVGHATVDGERRAIFVPRVAVGDEVDVDVNTSSRPARGRVLQVLSPGPGRVPPPCAYVDRCGACDWMHLSRPAQSAAREHHLRRVLPPRFRDIPIVFHDDTASLGYRTRARLHVRASGGRAVVGMHAVGSHDVIEVSTCVVLHEALDRAVARVGALLEGAHGYGEAQIALGKNEKPVVELHWHGKIDASSFGRLERGIAAGEWAGGTVHLDGVSRPAVVGDPAPRMSSSDGRELVLPSGGFAQASNAGNLVLGARVAALATVALGSSGPATVVELFAGAGNFTVLLGQTFGRVVAVESDSAACEAARENLAARGLACKVTCADADRFTVPPKTDLVVLDPPRRGAKEASLALARSSVKAIVYVSCDTPTLGRDLASLAARFDVIAVESFAMFPGTSHSETVVALRRRREKAS